jgi:uncharacterized paraquat-inducible protein A
VFVPPRWRLTLDREYFRVGPTPVNGWSAVHMLTGLALYRVPNAWIIHALWELFQISIGMTLLNREDAIDIALDTAAFEVGRKVLPGLLGLP